MDCEAGEGQNQRFWLTLILAPVGALRGPDFTPAAFLEVLHRLNPEAARLGHRPCGPFHAWVHAYPRARVHAWAGVQLSVLEIAHGSTGAECPGACGRLPFPTLLAPGRRDQFEPEVFPRPADRPRPAAP